MHVVAVHLLDTVEEQDRRIPVEGDAGGWRTSRREMRGGCVSGEGCLPCVEPCLGVVLFTTQASPDAI